MAVCPGQIRLQGLVAVEQNGMWVEDPTNPLYYLIPGRGMALPLYPQFGTQPNGYYIPPRWVPRPYLRQMFGPGVDRAIEAYGAALAAPPEAVLQLFRVSQTIIFSFEVIDGEKGVRGQRRRQNPGSVQRLTVIGYARDGSEVVRVSVIEEQFERPAKYLNSI